MAIDPIVCRLWQLGVVFDAFERSQRGFFHRGLRIRSVGDLAHSSVAPIVLHDGKKGKSIAYKGVPCAGQCVEVFA